MVLKCVRAGYYVQLGNGELGEAWALPGVKVVIITEADLLTAPNSTSTCSLKEWDCIIKARDVLADNYCCRDDT